MIFVHTVLWVATLGFAFRFLIGVAVRRGAGLLLAWLALYLVVSLQVASQMRPVLCRPEEMDLFAPRRTFFLDHFARIVAAKEGPTREQISTE
jgi:hypothetical protein